MKAGVARKHRAGDPRHDHHQPQEGFNMATAKFRENNFRTKSKQMIGHMVKIVADYKAQGLRLTARQLYYQFVSQNLITNTERSYKNLTALLTEARYAGLVDWDAIEDRGREPTVWQEFGSLKDCVDRALRTYRLKRWDVQPNYVELWVEKQALAGVLEPLAGEFHVTLMVNKGYSSASAMYESAKRFLVRQRQFKPLFLLYLGDHDPSGEDMVRDIGDRMKEFGLRELTVQKIALTMDQVRQYNPPPNPAKTTDSRYEAYASEHGTSSWEVDALPPNVLQQLIRDALEEVLDRGLWDEVIEQERNDVQRLGEAVEELR
jgi:hypothetical protein